MKFNRIKQTFKNGMASPRLRGRNTEEGVINAAEKLENFIVDRVGASIKRFGLEAPLKQPFINTGDFFFTYDDSPIADSVTTKNFAVNIFGEDYIFRFNTTKTMNAIVNTVNPSTVAHYQSTFLNIISMTDGTKQDTRPFAPYYTGTAVFTPNIDLTAFNESLDAGTGQDTLLSDYINRLCNPTTMTKISERTYLFTCSDETISTTNLSFTVSLIDLPITGGGVAGTSEVFVILPYFVNVRAFVANLGKSTVTTTYYNPIHPTNFPFNPINTNASLIVNFAVVAGQTGAATASGVLSYPGDKLNWAMTVQQDMCLSRQYGATYVSADALLGKFIIVPNGAGSDSVFFVLKHASTGVGTFTYSVMQIIGGTPVANTTAWKLSTFGGESHPRTSAYCFGRLMYGNAGLERDKWWASGIHPSNILNFQGFMGFSLTQDATTDASKMQYEGVATPATITITDVYRYGFTDVVPNLSPIYFIESRSKIHFGTHNGETQLTIPSTGFLRASYDQTIVRTNSAAAFPTTKGDGKFFYISNGGKDIRFISTEDKYYESLDGLMTTSLEGLGLSFNKIVWFEKLNSIIARTTTNRIFIITVHEDTQIKAISELVSSLAITDFCVAFDNLYFIFNYRGYQHISRYADDAVSAGDLFFSTTNAAEFSSTNPADAHPVLFAFAASETLYSFMEGVEYSQVVPASGIPLTYPFDTTRVNASRPAFFYSKKITAKLKTLPLDEGAAGNNSSIGDVIRVDRATIQIDNSGPFKVGTDGGTLYDAEGVQLTSLSTKFVNFDMPQSPDIENHVYIETDKPTPLNISGISYRGVSNSGE